jgi:predicted transcriptional regulator
MTDVEEQVVSQQIDERVERLAKAENLTKADAYEQYLRSPAGMRLRAVLERTRDNYDEAKAWVAAAEDGERYESVRKVIEQDR